MKGRNLCGSGLDSSVLSNDNYISLRRIIPARPRARCPAAASLMARVSLSRSSSKCRWQNRSNRYLVAVDDHLRNARNIHVNVGDAAGISEPAQVYDVKEHDLPTGIEPNRLKVLAAAPFMISKFTSETTEEKTASMFPGSKVPSPRGR